MLLLNCVRPRLTTSGHGRIQIGPLPCIPRSLWVPSLLAICSLFPEQFATDAFTFILDCINNRTDPYKESIYSMHKLHDPPAIMLKKSRDDNFWLTHFKTFHDI